MSSKRISRVNELLQREISDQMRRYYRSEAVSITISDVATTADLRNARVFYSVLGDEKAIAAAKEFFRKKGGDIHQRVSREITLKYFPRFEYRYDPSMVRGSEILNLLDELENENG